VHNRWLSRRAFVLHFLLVTVVPGCFLAGWWQVHRALSGNLLSYFYSIEWPIFAVLGVIAWWQLVHDQPEASDYQAPREVRRSRLHRDDEIPSRPLVWDEALESPELKAYNDYLRALAAGRGRKTWRNPKGLAPSAGPGEDDVIELGAADVEPAVPASRPGPAQ
jgi:DNA-binding transcriptional regulator of glucitol operon